MPPFLIPIGVAVGAVGAAGGVAAVWRKMRRGRRRDEARSAASESRYRNYAGFARRTQRMLDRLQGQLLAAVETLRESADFLVSANVTITPEQFDEIENVVASLRGVVARLGVSYAASGAASAAPKIDEATIGKHRAELTAFREHAREMSETVGEAERALKDTLRRASPNSLEDVYNVAIAAKALAELLDTED